MKNYKYMTRDELIELRDNLQYIYCRQGGAKLKKRIERIKKVFWDKSGN